MILYVLLGIPLIGIFVISSVRSYYSLVWLNSPSYEKRWLNINIPTFIKDDYKKNLFYKKIAFIASTLNLIISLIIYILFDFSNNQFQFIQEHYDLSFYDIYLGIDGISIYFVLLTTIIMPIALISNWNSITNNIKSYLIIMLLLETLLLAVFLVLDILLFYIFFESILPPVEWCGKSFVWDKLPNYGDLLKFLVPSYIWKYVNGWSNYSDMVTSQKICENKMDNRVSKSIIVAYAENIIVKEQRVDGSCIGNSTKNNKFPMLRCTLKGFERSYPFRILSNQINHIRLYSTVNTYEVKPHRELDLLNPYFVTGFTDAEGSFIVRVRKNPATKLGWSVEVKFSIGIHKKDIAVLKLFQNYFYGVGSLTKASKDTLHYRVASLSDLTNIIIPHFDNYPLITQKKADFLLFKDIVNLMNNKEHLTIEGLHKIVAIKAYLNLGLSEDLKIAFPNIVVIKRPLIKNQEILDPYWLAGFASGEACFTVYIYKSKTNIGEAVQLKFDLAQHSRDSEILISLKNYIGCGAVNKHFENAVMFTTTKFSDITEKILPFFDKYKIIGVKFQDYQDLKEVANLMKKKAHLTTEGLENIRVIKAGMNRGRV